MSHPRGPQHHSHPNSHPHTHSGSHRGSHHHTNTGNTNGSMSQTIAPQHNSQTTAPLGIENIDEDAEYTQIQALQEQLQQQQRQLMLQSHQLKQLKNQIKNQDETQGPDAVLVNQGQHINIPQSQQAQAINTYNMKGLKPYHFENDPPMNINVNTVNNMTTNNKPNMPTNTNTNYLNVSGGHQQQFSDSDDGITNGPFPTLAFDEHSNNSQFVNNNAPQTNQQQQNIQQSNPNLAIPHPVWFKIDRHYAHKIYTQYMFIPRYKFK